MTLAFARGMAPETPYLMAGLLRDRRARRPRGRSWLRIAHRLAAGLPPAAAALPEGADEQLVLHLLRHEEPPFSTPDTGHCADGAGPCEVDQGMIAGATDIMGSTP